MELRITLQDGSLVIVYSNSLNVLDQYDWESYEVRPIALRVSRQVA